MPVPTEATNLWGYKLVLDSARADLRHAQVQLAAAENACMKAQSDYDKIVFDILAKSLGVKISGNQFVNISEGEK